MYISNSLNYKQQVILLAFFLDFLMDPTSLEKNFGSFVIWFFFCIYLEKHKVLIWNASIETTSSVIRLDVREYQTLRFHHASKNDFNKVFQTMFETDKKKHSTHLLLLHYIKTPANKKKGELFVYQSIYTTTLKTVDSD